jgi:hypothetical protein
MFTLLTAPVSCFIPETRPGRPGVSRLYLVEPVVMIILKSRFSKFSLFKVGLRSNSCTWPDIFKIK